MNGRLNATTTIAKNDSRVRVIWRFTGESTPETGLIRVKFASDVSRIRRIWTHISESIETASHSIVLLVIRTSINCGISSDTWKSIRNQLPTKTAIVLIVKMKLFPPRINSVKCNGKFLLLFCGRIEKLHLCHMGERGRMATDKVFLCVCFVYKVRFSLIVFHLIWRLVIH